MPLCSHACSNTANSSEIIELLRCRLGKASPCKPGGFDNQNPGWLVGCFFQGWNILPSFMGILISHYKDPYGLNQWMVNLVDLEPSGLGNPQDPQQFISVSSISKLTKLSFAFWMPLGIFGHLLEVPFHPIYYNWWFGPPCNDELVVWMPLILLWKALKPPIYSWNEGVGREK